MPISIDQLLIYLLIFLSEFVGTLVVFGSSAFFLPIAIRVLNKNQALGIMSFFQVISNLYKIPFFIRKIDWKIVTFFGLPSLLMVILGSKLTIGLNTYWFRIGLGIVLMLLVIFEVFKHIEIPKNPYIEMIGGMFSGFVSGLIGTGGAIRGFFIFSFHLPKDVLIGTYCFIDFSGDLVRFLIYANYGFLDAQAIKLIPGAIIATLIANILGLYVLKRIPLQYFKPILMTTIFVLALLMLFNL
jgi:uncharacterized protein